MKKYIDISVRHTKSHPYITMGGVLLVLCFGWYATKSTASSATTTMVLGQVSRGSVVKSVSGTGKITAAKQWDLKPKVAGDVTSVLVRAGQKVMKGDVLVRLNANDAYKSARDARVAYESAQASAGKQSVQDEALKRSVTADETLTTAMTQMAQFYTSYALIDKDFESTLHDRTADPSTGHARNVDYYAGYDSAFSSYPKDTDMLYAETKTEYAAGLRALEAAKNATGNTSDDDRRNALAAAEKLTRTATTLSKKTMDLLRAFEYRLAQDDSSHSAQPLVASERATTQADINTLSSAYKNFLDADTALLSYQQSLEESPYDAKSSVLAVRERANALNDAEEHIGDYSIVAPEDGIVASLPVKEGDNITSGTVAVSVVTPEMEASLSLSEVDAASVFVGQNATLSFDAFPDLILTGKVVEKDLLGTVSSNVVSYTVKIAPDAPDSRLLPNMSVSASIITAVKPGVLMVPSGAVKTSSNGSTIQAPDPTDPALNASSTSKGINLALATIGKSVTIGLVGDTYTEIVEGLVEGDRIVVRSNKTAAAGSAAGSQKSIFQAAGGGGAGGLSGGRGGR